MPPHCDYECDVPDCVDLPTGGPRIVLDTFHPLDRVAEVEWPNGMITYARQSGLGWWDLDRREWLVGWTLN